MTQMREYFAYFDESGTHDDAPVLILGGLLGTTAEFAALGTETRPAWKPSKRPA